MIGILVLFMIINATHLSPDSLHIYTQDRTYYYTGMYVPALVITNEEFNLTVAMYNINGSMLIGTSYHQKHWSFHQFSLSHVPSGEYYIMANSTNIQSNKIRFHYEFIPIGATVI